MKQTGIAVSFGEPRNVTDRKGYDNQPSFTPKGDAVLYTVDRRRSGKTDTWRFTLPDGKPRARHDDTDEHLFADRDAGRQNFLGDPRRAGFDAASLAAAARRQGRARRSSNRSI